MSFARDGYTYVVLDRTVRTGFGVDGHDGSGFAAELVVVRNNTVVSHAACRTDATMAAAAATLPPTAFVDHLDRRDGR